MKSRIRTKIITTFILCLLFSRCSKEEHINVQNLNHDIIMILGHAGMGDMYKYPNNTMESIEPVIGIGTDGTEMDIQMTKDSILILFHDETLDGRTRCAGYTSAYDYNWSEIKDCYYNTLVDNIPIYTVEEIFTRIPNLKDYYFSFDTKLDPDHFYDEKYRRKYMRAIKRVCEKYNISNNVFIEGDIDLLLIAKELGMLTKGILIGGTVDDAVQNEIFGIGFTVDAGKDDIDYAHKKGIYVMMWGAKSDAGNKQAIKLNPDFLQTEKPIPILMLFNRFNFDYNIP